MPAQTQLHKICGCENPHRTVDVIFVHGLDGDAVETWRYSQKPDCLWPEWLGQELPNAGIWTLGYAVSSSAWKGTTMPLTDRAINVLEVLDLDGIGSRPIVFICHSLGGLLIKQVLRTAFDYSNENHLKIARQAKAIIFLATPHSGSNLADWMECIGALQTTVSVTELKVHDPHLRDLNNWYRNNTEAAKIETVVYYETLAVAGLVIVVNPSTADPGIRGVIATPVDADHISICKFPTKDHLIYRRTKKTIEKYHTQVGNEPSLIMAQIAGSPSSKGIVPNGNLPEFHEFRTELEQHRQKIATLERGLEKVTAKTFGDSLEKEPAKQSNPAATSNIRAENEPVPVETKLIQPMFTAALDAESHEPHSATSCPDGDDQIADDWISKLEDLLEVDVPKAIELSPTVEAWVKTNETHISRGRVVKLYRLLYRIEHVKIAQNYPDADKIKAKEFLAKGRL